MPKTEDFDELGRPIDYNTPRGMNRRQHFKSSYRRRGRDGRMHTVTSHTQRYWHGGKNFGARPIMKDIEQPSEGWRPRSARRRYYETSTLRQRQMDNKQKAEHKREPIFGVDKDGNILKDPDDPGNVLIHPDEWWLWVSQPNQYDVVRVDDPLPKGWVVERNKINPYEKNQDVEIIIRNESGDNMGTIAIDLLGSYLEDKIIRKTTAQRLGINSYDWKEISPGMVEVPVYGNWIGEPVLGVSPQYREKGVATYLIREAIDMADANNIKSTVLAVPDPGKTGIENAIGMANLRDMYTSFGLESSHTVEEIFEKPDVSVNMWRDRYEVLEPGILFGREVEPIPSKATTSQRLPDTANYKDSPRKALESRLEQREKGVIRRR